VAGYWCVDGAGVYSRRECMKAIASIEIIDNAGTYLKEGSILQVFMDQEWTLFAVEEYEKGSPCQHPLNDLMDDKIKFKFVMTEQFEALGQ
jgi:hypothetical protein